MLEHYLSRRYLYFIQQIHTYHYFLLLPPPQTRLEYYTVLWILRLPSLPLTFSLRAPETLDSLQLSVPSSDGWWTTDGSADAEGGDYYRSQAGVFPIRWTGE